jgi:glycosyltransferase involved in cell wall biosynthesis
MYLLNNVAMRGGFSVTKLNIAAIMPLYNKRRYVVEAVESMLNQTRPADEIVIVDDGSTDGSGDFVAERYGHDPRIQLIRQPNRGVSAARNVAIDVTRSPLVAFLDADDKWLPEKLERQSAFMEQNPSCMMSFTSSIGHNERTGETWYTPLLGNIPKDRFIRKEYFPQRSYIATNSVMIRRNALDEVGLFDESLWMSEDADLWLRIMLRFGFEYMPERLVWVRRGFPRSIKTMEHGFKGNDRYFAKHRYTFGRGVLGQAIWRAGYASVLRGHANWYFRQRMGRKAMAYLVRAVCLWPFFDPTWVVKSGLEYLLGSEKYDKAVRAVRKLIGHPRRPAEPKPSDVD